MANQVSGRVIAVSKLQTIASSDPQRPPMQKRELFLDCTRYDPYTGERSQYENKPLLEFAGEKVLEKVSPVLDALQKDDVVTVSFELQGRSYKDKNTGKMRVMTGIRCFDIEVRRKAGEQQYFDNHQPSQAAAPQAALQPQTAEPAPMATSPFPPAGQGGDSDLPF